MIQQPLSLAVYSALIPSPDRRTLVPGVGICLNRTRIRQADPAPAIVSPGRIAFLVCRSSDDCNGPEHVNHGAGCRYSKETGFALAASISVNLANHYTAFEQTVCVEKPV